MAGFDDQAAVTLPNDSCSAAALLGDNCPNFKSYINEIYTQAKNFQVLVVEDERKDSF